MSIVRWQPCDVDKARGREINVKSTHKYSAASHNGICPLLLLLLLLLWNAPLYDGFAA